MIEDPTASQGFVALVILYLAGLLVIAHRLKTNHNAVWVGLGRPSFLNWSISNSLALGGYIFFRNAFRQLDDRTLGRMIWAERAILVLTIISAIMAWLARRQLG